MRVLYIEDEPILAKVVRNHCSTFGFEVGIVNSLAEARRCLSLTTFDVLLVDLNLPDSRGAETVELLKPYCLPIVVLTCDKTPECETKCRSLGVDEFMLKTDINKGDFASRIDSVYKKHLVKWSQACDFEANFAEIKPYICTAKAFARLSLAAARR